MLRISAPHFVAGVTPGVEAAPIIKYMKDWEVEKIYSYCRRKGWRVEEVRELANGASSSRPVNREFDLSERPEGRPRKTAGGVFGRLSKRGVRRIRRKAIR